jgi:hypothetical protein
MKIELRSISARIGSVAAYADPFEGLLNPTMAAGTWLLSNSLDRSMERAATPAYVALPVKAFFQYERQLLELQEAVFQYERNILELRHELSHYKDLLSELLPVASPSEEYFYAEPVVPLDASSVGLINSIISAQVPNSGTFLDFSEKEL